MSEEKSPNESNEQWMRKALLRGKDALTRGEVPVGCLFILDNEIIAVGANEVNQTKNATRHAEMTCIDQVLKICGETGRNHVDVFKEITVVVTVEPCIMCASALHQLRVRSIVYGAANQRFGGCSSVLDVSTVHDSSGVSVEGGVFAEEAVNLLKLFYDGTNPNAPKPNIKKMKVEEPL